MDKKEDYVLPSSGALPDTARSRVVGGAKQLRKALLRRTAKEIYLALDADPAVTAPLAALCEQCGIVPGWVASMALLGRACGIDVGAAAAAVVE